MPSRATIILPGLLRRAPAIFATAVAYELPVLVVDTADAIIDIVEDGTIPSAILAPAVGNNAVAERAHVRACLEIRSARLRLRSAHSQR